MRPQTPSSPRLIIVASSGLVDAALPAHNGERQRPAERPRRARWHGALAKFLLTLALLQAAGAALFWQWPHLRDAYQQISLIRSEQQPSQPEQKLALAPKLPFVQGHVASSPSTLLPQVPPTVARNVVLYEEDASDTHGKRYDGVVRWQTEIDQANSASKPIVRGDVEIPDRRTTIVWRLRDGGSPGTSHTVEITFHLPVDFPDGGIRSIPGIMLKQSKEETGTPLVRGSGKQRRLLDRTFGR